MLSYLAAIEASEQERGGPAREREVHAQRGRGGGAALRGDQPEAEDPVRDHVPGREAEPDGLHPRLVLDLWRAGTATRLKKYCRRRAHYHFLCATCITRQEQWQPQKLAAVHRCCRRHSCDGQLEGAFRGGLAGQRRAHGDQRGGNGPGDDHKHVQSLDNGDDEPALVLGGTTKTTVTAPPAANRTVTIYDAWREREREPDAGTDDPVHVGLAQQR